MAPVAGLDRDRLALPGVEGELVHVRIDDDGVALLKLALEHLERQRVQHAALDRALERAGAVDRVVALLDEQVLGGVGELERDLALAQAAHEAGELDLDDLAQLLLRERVEDDDLVDAVDELRREVL